MREKKDILEQIIKEDLEKEAAKIRETITGMEQEVLSAEKKAEIKEKLYEEINEYDVARLMEQLPERYKKAMKVGLESMNNAGQSSGEEPPGTEDKIPEQGPVSGDWIAGEAAIDGTAAKDTSVAGTAPAGAAPEEVPAAESPGSAGEIEMVSDREGRHSGAAKKKNICRRRMLRGCAGAAAVFVMAAALGINSFGGPENVMKIVKSMVGGREVVKVNSSEENLVIEGEKEEEAYQEIKEAFGISPVKIIDRPRGMKFVSADVEKDAQIAELLYKYDDKNVLYMINMAYSKDSFGMDVEDKAIDEYNIEVRGVDIHIKEYQVAETETKKYLADFDYKKTKYFLIGTMEKSDFELILKNFYFSS